MSMPNNEDEMIPKVHSVIERIYGVPRCVAKNIKIMGRKPDILYIYDGEPEAVAVELKINDWRRGLAQALSYTLIAKYVYLAIRYIRKRNIDLELFKLYGIGVIAVNDDPYIVVEARPSVFYKHQVMKEYTNKLCKDKVY